jgi:enoyl-CoA hydratase/carnithine racemase
VENVDFESLTYGVPEGVATVVLSRADAPNALTPAMLAEIRRAIEEAGQDDGVGVIVLTGAGRAFSAGVDLKALGDVELEGGSDGQILANSRGSIAAYKHLYRNGMATDLAGALELEFGSELEISDTEARLGEFLRK